MPGRGIHEVSASDPEATEHVPPLALKFNVHVGTEGVEGLGSGAGGLVPEIDASQVVGYSLPVVRNTRMYPFAGATGPAPSVICTLVKSAVDVIWYIFLPVPNQFVTVVLDSVPLVVTLMSPMPDTRVVSTQMPLQSVMLAVMSMTSPGSPARVPPTVPPAFAQVAFVTDTVAAWAT